MPTRWLGGPVAELDARLPPGEPVEDQQRRGAQDTCKHADDVQRVDRDQREKCIATMNRGQRPHVSMHDAVEPDMG